MSKRFASLLIGGLAAVLLGAPVQAQAPRKALARTHAEKLHAKPVLKDNAKDLKSQELFLKAGDKQAEVLRTAEEARHADGDRQFADIFSLRGTAFGAAVSSLYAQATPSARAPRLAATETVNDHGVITAAPEGEVKFYQRSGTSWFRNNNQQVYAEQSGYIKVVETADGTVYFLDFISGFNSGNWIKGTREGDVITIPTGQLFYWWDDYNYGIRIAYAEYDTAQNSFVETKVGDPIIMNVEGDKLVLQGTSFDFDTDEGLIVGSFYTDQYDGAWSNFGDHETVLTYDPTYIVPELVTLPAGVTAETWQVKGQKYNGNALAGFKGEALIAFDGSDVYLGGIFDNFPEAWIKGTLSGSTVTFAGAQFVGEYGSAFVYGIGASGLMANDVLADFVLTYDAAAEALTAQNTLLANGATDRVYFLEAFSNLVFAKNGFPEPTAQTGAPVDQLPYQNGFDTTAAQAQFGILDANEDGKTWSYVADVDGMAARYNYAGDQNGDDWLISPAIKLEAGKSYRVAFESHTYNNNWAERFEVKLGTAAKPSALSQTIIPETTFASAEIVEYENGNVQVAETGYYHVGIHCISNANMYYLFIDNFIVEQGALPGAPSGVTDLTVVNSDDPDELAAVLTFTAPATAVDGSALTDNISKIEVYRDKELVGTIEDVVPGSQVTYVDRDNGLTLGNHSYQLIPYNAHGVGAKSDVVTAFISAQLYAPTTFDLSKQEIFDLFTVIDNNGDGSTWAFSSSFYTYYRYSSSRSGDDYVVSLPVKLVGGRNYSVTVEVAAMGSYPERFEVVVGREATASGLNTVVVPATTINHTDFVEYEGDFTAPEDGNYYLAVHAISDADQYYLKVKSLGIEAGLEPTSPLAARLSVQPDPYGAEKAVVTVTAPRNSLDGNRLTSISRLEVLRDKAVIKSYENVNAEDIKVFVDAVSGAHNYQAIAYGANGERGQKSQLVQTYVGLDTPAGPENVKFTETADGIVATWDAVAVGENGGIVVPGELTYTVYTAHQEQGFFGPQWVIDDPIAETTETTVFIDHEFTGSQQLTALFVSAKNSVGESGANGNYFFDGEPFAMPFEEHFAQSWNYPTWLIIDSTDDDLAYVANSGDASDGDSYSTTNDYGQVINGGAVAFVAEADNQYVACTPGKIAMRQGGNPTLILDLKGDGNTRNSFLVKVQTVDGTVTTVAAITPTTQYKSVKVSLADFAAQPFVKLILAGNFKDAGTITFDNVKVTDLLEYNLTAKIEAPATVQAGSAADVKVTVRNQGEKPAKDFTVKVLAGNKEIFSQTETETLASFGVKEYSVKLTTSKFDDPVDITLRAEVEYDYDLDDEDNTAETVVTVKQSNAPQPENVKAEATADGVQLSWQAPSSSVQEVTEDIEDQTVFVPWTTGGITKEGSHTGKFGDWTVYDGNGLYTYVFDGANLPGDIGQGEAHAWAVFNAIEADQYANGFSGAYAAHSGEQYLISFCPADQDAAGNTLLPAADHWLISPALPGVAQTISFFYRAITDQYGAETFEVWASSTDNQVESFTKVGSYSTTATTWTELTVDLPAGTTYFAIRHTAQDIFGLLIDDITYTAGGGEIAQYNIYVDGELAESVPASQLTFTIQGGSVNSVYAVSAVSANGQESRPVVAVVSSPNQELTGIEAITGSREPADIYTIDGKLVRSQATDLRGLKGAYVINGQKVVVK